MKGRAMEQIQLTFNFENNKQAQAFLAKVEGNESTAGRAPRGTGTRSAANADTEVAESGTSSASAGKRSRGSERTEPTRASKSTKSRDEDLDLGFEDDETEETESEETQYSFEDVAEGFRAFVAKYDKTKAAKVLAKLGVKSIKDLDEEQYADAMELIKK